MKPDAIRLRLLEAGDLPRTLAWRNQDHIRRWFFFSEQITPEQHAGWFAKYQERDDDFVFIIEEHAGQQTELACEQGDLCIGWRPMGQVAIYNIDWREGTAEYGRLMIGESDARPRAGREATDLLLELAIEHLGLQEVYLEVISSNERAIKVYEGCGFEITGSTEKALRMSKRAVAKAT